MKLKRSHWAAATAVWALALMFVSVVPGRDLPSVSIWEADKIFHALFYGILTFFTFRFLQLKTPSAPKIKTLVLAGVLCILYGFLIELIQLILPTRSFDWLDEVANCIGCGIAVVIISFFRNKEKFEHNIR